MTGLRIATWNLARLKPGGRAMNSERLQTILKQNADIWVLTETSSAMQLSGYQAAASDKACETYAAGESTAVVWSRFPIRRIIPTYDRSSSICAEIESPLGPMLVYGTIITYANDRGDGTARKWVEHRKAIERQGADWLALRRDFPSHCIVVAGDFNQARDGSGWYHDPLSVGMLTRALAAASLACVTEEDLRKAGVLRTRATVDHICVSQELVPHVSLIGAWEGITEEGNKMSDHNGIYADIAPGRGGEDRSA